MCYESSAKTLYHPFVVPWDNLGITQPYHSRELGWMKELKDSTKAVYKNQTEKYRNTYPRGIYETHSFGTDKEGLLHEVRPLSWWNGEHPSISHQMKLCYDDLDTTIILKAFLKKFNTACYTLCPLNLELGQHCGTRSDL